MEFNDRDKDYFFALLENILKCQFLQLDITPPNQRMKMKREVKDFMIKRELLEE